VSVVGDGFITEFQTTMTEEEYKAIYDVIRRAIQKGNIRNINNDIIDRGT